MGGNMSQPLEDESMTNLYLLLYYFSFFLLSNNELLKNIEQNHVDLAAAKRPRKMRATT
jgi:hypothetical protein